MSVLRRLTRALERWAYLHPQAPALTPQKRSEDVPAPFYVNRNRSNAWKRETRPGETEGVSINPKP